MNRNKKLYLNHKNTLKYKKGSENNVFSMLFILMSFMGLLLVVQYDIFSIISSLLFGYHSFRFEEYIKTRTQIPINKPLLQLNESLINFRLSTSYYPPVFMDYMLPSTKFKIEQYLTLESLLVSSFLSKSKFYILLIGPESTNYYKTGMRFSKHQFEKYIKLGYDLKVHVEYKFPGMVDINQKKITKQPSTFDLYSAIATLGANIGTKFWELEFNNCCVSKVKKIRSGGTTSWSLSIFLRLYRLYQYGGIYIDFLVDTNHLDMKYIMGINQGAIFNSHIDDDSNTKCNINNDNNDNNDNNGNNGNNDNNISLNNNEECYISSVLVFHEKQHPVVACMLKYFGDSSEESIPPCLLSNSRSSSSSSSSSVNCIMKAFDKCFEENQVINELSHFKDKFTWNTFKNLDIIRNSNSGSIYNNPFNYHPDLKGISKDCYHQHRIKYEYKNGSTCNFYDVNLHGTLHDNIDMISKYSCSPSFVIPGFMKSGTTFLFETMTKHPQIIHALVGVGFKETGCYLPGEMVPNKADNRIKCFPFVRSGEPFKFGDATTTYAGDRTVPLMMKRDNPHLKAIFVIRNTISRLQSHHRFMYRHFLSKGLPNINDGILSVLPYDGSHLNQLRLHANTLITCIENMKNEDQQQILPSGKCRNFEDSLISLYHLGDHVLKSPYRQMQFVIKNSIYFPAILHWRRILGTDNILIVNSENLQIKSKKSNHKIIEEPINKELNRIYSFLDICNINQIPRTKIHVTDSRGIPIEHELNDTMRNILIEFFRPFDKLQRLYMITS